MKITIISSLENMMFLAVWYCIVLRYLFSYDTVWFIYFKAVAITFAENAVSVNITTMTLKPLCDLTDKSYR